MRDDCQVIIMAKAPVLGKVKTRLMSVYTAAEAMAWHERMCRAVIQQTQALFQHVCIATDNVNHPFWHGVSCPIVSQGEGDLGARLQRMVEHPASRMPLLFLGTDSPHMADARLLAAADALQRHDLVIGPVEDGGYNLIGLSCIIPHLFAATDWGTSSVCQQTCHQAAAYNIAMLEKDFDIDTPEDLQRALLKPHDGWLS
jgi:hypothetical protein